VRSQVYFPIERAKAGEFSAKGAHRKHGSRGREQAWGGLTRESLSRRNLGGRLAAGQVARRERAVAQHCAVGRMDGDLPIPRLADAI
jgi:hypothetical protein